MENYLKKAKEKQQIKIRNRAKTCPPKVYRDAPVVKQLPNVPQSLMFAKIKQETKALLVDQGMLINPAAPVNKELPPRQERRRSMLDLARKTLKSLREKGVHQAPTQRAS
jgi:hypothetical protein